MVLHCLSSTFVKFAFTADGAAASAFMPSRNAASAFAASRLDAIGARRAQRKRPHGNAVRSRSSDMKIRS